jgi:hypothetical protein
MNFKKVEKAAKKINQLLDNMRDEDHISSIEKDLLLSYIRDMYEKVINEDEGQKKSNKSAGKSKKESGNHVAQESSAPVHTPPPVAIADVVRQEIKETSYPQETPIEQIVSTVSEPVIEASAASPIIENSTVSQPITPIETSEEEPVSHNNVSPELTALFESETISELSDKLSRSPISDLTKCMGINERIFTVNELFGGDTSIFNTTMRELDKLASLEQARDYLVNGIAVEQNWASESKIKKATNFIKLISRRY